MEQKPSIGRIVVYNHPGSADGKYPPTQSPAIIQNVAADGTVRLRQTGEIDTSVLTDEIKAALSGPTSAA